MVFGIGSRFGTSVLPAPVAFVVCGCLRSDGRASELLFWDVSLTGAVYVARLFVRPRRHCDGTPPAP